MLRIVLLFLTLSGLQARPLPGFQENTDVFSGDSPRTFPGDLNTNLLKDDISDMSKEVATIRTTLGNGFGEMRRRHWLTDELSDDVPAQRVGDGGWVRGEHPSNIPQLTSSLTPKDSFRQGTEPTGLIPDVEVKKVSASYLSVGFRQGTEPTGLIPDVEVKTPGLFHLPGGFRQGTEPTGLIPDVIEVKKQRAFHLPGGFRQGTDPTGLIPDVVELEKPGLFQLPGGFRQGTEPTGLILDVEVKKQNAFHLPGGFRQGTEPTGLIPDVGEVKQQSAFHLPGGFRQGTEPSGQESKAFQLPAGFRQGTEPAFRIPEGFRQGTQNMKPIPDGFRQGTEPVFKIPENFRQGTQPGMSIPEGFRQGTEPAFKIPDGFRQGTQRMMPIPEGFRQGTEPSVPMIKTQMTCKGFVFHKICYEFNQMPMTFKEAQVSCKTRAPGAELASITSGDLHSRLVSLVTKGGEKNPVLTWLGGTVQDQKASWVDSSEWTYSDWKPGHPDIHTEKPVCMEMFQIDESWWTAADCDLERASLCSFPVTA
ncbi:uncharacterized protein LOC103389747 [Cynoglossus semilaevis]|uniref:uncharacterized protein LOC103389747 n=1 Tax=Cynoglossus semilaevis TaxID=244447 RepID=UPI00049526BB|nr:uncharacterized protein LOC103389747 [Cynoglossus semilaevis]